ncbi:beta-lactamase family protein [Acidovorax sp. D2M1]|uniref:Beta-lactamase family protein n=1 Tax=Acidovorax benzenivorans TaxID=2987520 RepID=A0ABT5RT79_9BURK|nr:serine hydrolase [Acidovorax benzenivorans]MDD2176108.1 beta-lactamase family protein [Acidovorax benzenivorans]
MRHFHRHLTRSFTAVALACTLLVAAPASQAQAPQLPPPDATNPVTLQLMQGFPPPPDKLVRLANTLKYPNVRWAAQHLRELGPTATVWRGAAAPSALPAAPRALPDTLAFADGKGAPTTLADWQKATYTDALLVLHRGRVVYERYHIGMQPQQPHVLWSMSKSLVGLLVTELIQEGTIDANAPIPRYLPELASSAWADATVQQTLDMTTGVKYAENFADPTSGVFQYLAAAGLQPAPPGSNLAKSMAEHLPTVQKEGEHGTAFAYKSVDSEVLGWLLQRVTGKSYATLLSERIWSRLGTQEDAYVFADANGGQATSVGVNATLRDLGRLGEMLRSNGRFNGQQIVSPATIAELRKGADPALFSKAPGTAMRAGYSYHNQWWVPHDADGSFEAKGLMGQHIHINPAAELVVVKLSSHPVPNTAFTHALDRQAFAALAKAVR